jgi:hypothetical protein
MTTPQEDDRFDRRIPGASRPTARNTELYSEYVPLQRLSMYVNNYLAVVRMISAHGQRDEEENVEYGVDHMEDEMAILLAAMAHDTEAYEAAIEIFNSDEIDNATKYDLGEMMNAVYGGGSFTLPDANPLSAEVNALKFPRVPMDRTASNDWKKQSIVDWGETVDGRLDDLGFGAQPRDFYATGGITVSGAANLLDRAAELVGGDLMPDDPNFGDLFEFTLSTSSAPNTNTFWQQAANASDIALPGITDLMVGRALGMMMVYVGAGALIGKIPGVAKFTRAGDDMLAPALGGGTVGAPPAGSYSVLNEAGELGGKALAARARLAAPYLGASVANLAYSAYLGNQPLTEGMRSPEQGDSLAAIYEIGRTQQTERREQESIAAGGTRRGTRLKPSPPIDIEEASYGRVN